MRVGPGINCLSYPWDSLGHTQSTESNLRDTSRTDSSTAPHEAWVIPRLSPEDMEPVLKRDKGS